MKQMLSKWRLLPCILLLAHPALAEEDADNLCGLTVSDAWVRAAPPGMAMLAGYATVHNPTGQPLTINTLITDDFGFAEIHRSEEVDGMMRMRELESVVIPAGGSHRFEPGGDHMMLMQPRRQFAVGDVVELSLCCGDRPVPVQLTVRR